MKQKLNQIILSPVTHFNVLVCASLIVIGVMHEHTHRQMEVDVHGYVRQFCRNSDKCQFSDY